jgi:putative acetyltransferase
MPTGHAGEHALLVRPETPADIEAIRHINIVAFDDHPKSVHNEHLIVDALRDAGALQLSLVAEQDGKVVGHVAFSAASIGGIGEWALLGPVGVLPQWQRRGVGSALIREGLETMRARGVRGCVLVGDAAYYRRFGFAQGVGVTCGGVPEEAILCLPMLGDTPSGELAYHLAFSVKA